MDSLETLALAVPVSDNVRPDIMKRMVKEETDSRPQEPDLAALIRAGARGDLSAVEQIYQRFKTPVYNLAYRYTLDAAASEDILQEVFIKVFTHLADINNADTFPAWVYRVGVNASLSYLRSRKQERQKRVPLADIEGRLEEASYDADTSHLRRPIEDAVEALSVKLKSVFLLHDVQGFKHEEIARILGCSVGTSKSNLFKARMKIRRHLKAMSIEASS